MLITLGGVTLLGVGIGLIIFAVRHPSRMEDLLNCPKCNSLQKFARRTQSVDAQHYEIFIACRMCSWEKVLDAGTKRELKLRAAESKIAALERAGIRVPDSYIESVRRARRNL